MKKEQVEQILIRVSTNGAEALNMKIYKEGTTTRRGAGGLPELGISALSHFGDDRFFAPLMNLIPEEVLAQPIMVEEGQGLEYVVGFYGQSRNGNQGEGADWALSTGIRLSFDPQGGQPEHSIFGLLDTLSVAATELTNSWYFDVMMLAKWNMQSAELPPQTMIAQPKTEKEIHESYLNYVNQMYQSPMKWSLGQYGKGKIFEREGQKYRCLIQEGEGSFQIDFLPEGPLPEEFTRKTAPKTALSSKTAKGKKPWWKFW